MAASEMFALCHAVSAQWHWGNIASMLSGVSTIIIAVAALIGSPGAMRDWRARQADAAKARAEADREAAEESRLERRRTLLGWSAGGVETYTVAEVTDPAELEQAARELASGEPSAYAIVSVDEGEYSSANRARSLRLLAAQSGYFSRPPTSAEREALDNGFEALGVRSMLHR
jgi:hypothetical protein